MKNLLRSEHLKEPYFNLPQGFDSMSFNEKQKIITEVANQVYNHLYATSLDPKMDTTKLKSVIADIIANAIDATKNIERVIQVQAHRKDVDDKSRIIIEILDNGPGFPEEKLYQDLSAPIGTTKSVFTSLGGQGSGLHYCNLLVTKAGGSISYKNREEGGASVSLDLPAYKELSDTPTNTTYWVQ